MHQQPFDPNPPARGVRIFRDVMVDVLGTLLPGTIFVTWVIVLLWLPLAVLITPDEETTNNYSSKSSNSLTSIDEAVESRVETTRTPLEALRHITGNISLSTLFLLLMLGYVVGHLYTRQDPKLLDRKSFDKINLGKDDLEKWVCMKKPEFPYLRLRNYLRARNLHYLLPLIEWSEDKAEARSKSYINTLKVRLMWDFPDRCATILRNEAHIRLMSSVWYMGRSLNIVAIVSLLLGAVSFYLANRGILPEQDCYVLGTVLAFPPALTIVTSIQVGSLIKRAFHYQRVREVRHVLDTAYYAYGKKPVALKDLCPRYSGLMTPDMVEKEKRLEQKNEQEENRARLREEINSNEAS